MWLVIVFGVLVAVWGGIERRRYTRNRDAHRRRTGL